MNYFDKTDDFNRAHVRKAAQGPDLDIVMEYVSLPIADLSVPFLYRFISPVETCWSFGNLPMIDADRMHDFAAGTYLGYLYDLALRPQRINSIKVNACEIRPKPYVLPGRFKVTVTQIKDDE